MDKELKLILGAKFKATDIKPGFDGWDGMLGIVYKGKAWKSGFWGQDWVKNLEEDWIMDLVSEIDIYAFQEKGLPQAPSKNI